MRALYLRELLRLFLAVLGAALTIAAWSWTLALVAGGG